MHECGVALCHLHHSLEEKNVSVVPVVGVVFAFFDDFMSEKFSDVIHCFTDEGWQRFNACRDEILSNALMNCSIALSATRRRIAAITAPRYAIS